MVNERERYQRILSTLTDGLILLIYIFLIALLVILIQKAIVFEGRGDQDKMERLTISIDKVNDRLTHLERRNININVGRDSLQGDSLHAPIHLTSDLAEALVDLINEAQNNQDSPTKRKKGPLWYIGCILVGFGIIGIIFYPIMAFWKDPRKLKHSIATLSVGTLLSGAALISIDTFENSFDFNFDNTFKKIEMIQESDGIANFDFREIGAVGYFESGKNTLVANDSLDKMILKLQNQNNLKGIMLIGMTDKREIVQHDKNHYSGNMELATARAIMVKGEILKKVALDESKILITVSSGEHVSQESTAKELAADRVVKVYGMVVEK